MSNGFQTSVAAQPAPAVAGDFASANPYFAVDAGPGGLVSGPNGCVIGRFAWAVAPADGDGFPSQVNSYGTGLPTGFVPREQQGLITTYLQDSSMFLPAGFQVTLMSGTDFWVKNDGATQALPGQKAYANFADGKATFAATASATAGGTSTASTIAAVSSTFNGSITNDTLNVTSAPSNLLVAGALITVGAATGTRIVRQLSGTAGGIGTYAVSIPGQTVAAATAFTATYGLLTVGGTVVGSYGVGDVLATTGGVTAGTTIKQLGTGVGLAGTYYVDTTQTIGSGAIDVLAINIETKWTCMSSGLPGELVKMSSQPLG
jgi:hypothetical protein